MDILAPPEPEPEPESPAQTAAELAAEEATDREEAVKALSAEQGDTDAGAQGGHLNPLGLCLRAPTPCI